MHIWEYLLLRSRQDTFYTSQKLPWWWSVINWKITSRSTDTGLDQWGRQALPPGFQFCIFWLFFTLPQDRWGRVCGWVSPSVSHLESLHLTQFCMSPHLSSVRQMLSCALTCLHVSKYSGDARNTHKPPRTRRGTLISYHSQAFPVHYNPGTPVPTAVSHQHLPLLWSGHGLYPYPKPVSNPPDVIYFYTLLICDRKCRLSYQLSITCKLS